MPETQKATFAAGCFWGVEETFRAIPGVTKTTVGYTGGSLESPSYEDVCTGKTGHAEAVEIEFNPEQVSYDELLQAFWSSHDPTQLNRQGPDTGTQYRSAIFFHSPEQEQKARESKKSLESSGKFQKPIVTEISPAAKFWPAEDYHQKYLQKKGEKTCQ